MAKQVSDRVKASRLRKKLESGLELSEDEEAWIENYEDTKPQKAGRSASERVVHIEERAAAEGDHEHPEALAAAVRAEGLRADTLLNIVTSKLIQCNDQYMRVFEYMMERSLKLEEAHIALLEVVRDSHLARIKAEGEALQAQYDTGGGDSDMAEMLELLKVAKELRAQNATNPKKKVKDKGKEKPLGSID